MNPKSQYSKALNLSKKGKYEKAIVEFNKVIFKDPGNAEALCDRGVAKFHLKDIEGAIKDLDRALEIEPENPYRYASRAYIRDKAGDTSGAIDDYRMAVELDPENGVSQNNLGLLEEKLGYMDKAKKRFRIADSLNIDFSNEEIEALKKRDEMVSSLLNELNIKVDDQKSIEPNLLKQMLSIFTSGKERKDFLVFLKSMFKRG